MDGSSRDYKKDIRPLSEIDLQKLTAVLDEVEIVEYLYKEEEEGTPARVGMSADEMPHILATKKRKGLDTGRHIGFLMAVVKAINKENEEQSRLIPILTKKMQDQQTQIAELRRMVMERLPAD